MEKSRFEGKVVVVTGSGSGMGRTIAVDFASEGGYVAVVDVNESTANESVEIIRNQGGRADSYVTDIGNTSEIALTVKNILEKQGKIDILVNNAAISHSESFANPAPEQWNRMIDINLKGGLYFSYCVLEQMIERKYGKIINISSAAGRTGGPGLAVYSATKAGIIGFTKSLAVEVARKQINVNCICPGFIDTPMFSKELSNQVINVKANLDLIPMKRLGTTSEIAQVVLFLASDQASYINGQTVSVDGGLTRI